MAEVKHNNDRYGLQKLIECDMVELRLERSCCSHLYSVSSHAGTLFTSKGSRHYRLYNQDERLVISLNYERPWFETPYMQVQVVNCLPVKVVTIGSFRRALLIVDENDQTRLKIKKPMMSNTYKIQGADNIQVGWLKSDWGDWEIHFPLDLEVRYKAALIATCIYMDVMERDTQSSSSS